MTEFDYLNLTGEQVPMTPLLSPKKVSALKSAHIALQSKPAVQILKASATEINQDEGAKLLTKAARVDRKRPLDGSEPQSSAPQHSSHTPASSC